MLVGEGATDFAFQSGIPLLPLDHNISAPARQRWGIWSRDMEEHNRRNVTKANHRHSPPAPIERRMKFMEATNNLRLDHVNAMLQSISPVEPNPIEDTYERFQAHRRLTAASTPVVVNQLGTPAMESATPARGTSPEIPQMVDGPVESGETNLSSTAKSVEESSKFLN
jgi:hypothetical protein